MLINEVDDKSHITLLVIKELRQIGIKYQTEKQKRTTVIRIYVIFRPKQT